MLTRSAVTHATAYVRKTGDTRKQKWSKRLAAIGESLDQVACIDKQPLGAVLYFLSKNLNLFLYLSIGLYYVNDFKEVVMANI